MCHVAGGGDLMVPVHYCSPVLDRAGHHDWPSSQAAALQRLRHNVLQGKMQQQTTTIKGTVPHDFIIYLFLNRIHLGP